MEPRKQAKKVPWKGSKHIYEKHIAELPKQHRILFEYDEDGGGRCIYCRGHSLRCNYFGEHITKTKHIKAVERHTARLLLLKDPNVITALNEINIRGTLEPADISFRFELIKVVLKSGMKLGALKYWADLLEVHTKFKRIPDAKNLTVYIPTILEIEENSVKSLCNGPNLNKPVRYLIGASFDGTSKMSSEFMVLVFRMCQPDGAYLEKVILVLFCFVLF